MEKQTDKIIQAAGTGKKIVSTSFSVADIYVPDLSDNNRELDSVDLDNPDEFENWLRQKITESGKKIAIGGYGEDRVVYKRSKHFGQGADARSIHLGVDIWTDAHTEVLAPFDATVHSFRNNDNHGDYGGTIILEHTFNGLTFYTLYGHLSLQSLNHKSVGLPIKAGEAFATLGTPKENGGWPPHLHFQVICDMLDKKGDFFGVASPTNKAEMMELCPDPNLILKIF
ncbi:MAG: peptidoglycan DD-metalloendopeptidase family protein [Salinivirgaceae bacterium]|jgi:murein DD-endopeptidase MepM/ murein hydrolase activator NlpD|nr:peptidoglycan DD-metalloendopeptidase family protein [Salinivirgaceae bacterium]